MKKTFEANKICMNCGKKFNLLTDGGKYTETAFFDDDDEKMDFVEMCFCSDRCYEELLKDTDRLAETLAKELKDE